MGKLYTVEAVPKWAMGWGRYVCVWGSPLVAWLFDTGERAEEFARGLRDGGETRHINIGWLSPKYEGGRNCRKTAYEAGKEIGATIRGDYRKRHNANN